MDSLSSDLTPFASTHSVTLLLGPAHCAEIKSGKVCESALDVIKSAADLGLNVDYAKVAWSEPGKQTVILDEPIGGWK